MHVNRVGGLFSISGEGRKEMKSCERASLGHFLIKKNLYPGSNGGRAGRGLGGRATCWGGGCKGL